MATARFGPKVSPDAPFATDVELAAEAAARVAHEADTTAVHGIADTSQLVTQAVANATYEQLRTFAVEKYGAVCNGTSDDYAAVMAAIQAAYDAGGGVVSFPAKTVKIGSQLVMPNDTGAGNPLTAPRQPSIILRGAGGFFSGQAQPVVATMGGTILLLTYQNATYNNAKIVTRGLGSLVIEDLTLKDTSASSTTPFVFTTNTTLHLNRCAFIGAATSSWAQDAIVLGGTRKAGGNGHSDTYDDPNSAFQGYGSVISNCYFNGVRRVVYGRSYCNHTVVRDNFVDKNCGYPAAGGSCIEFNGGLDAQAGYSDGDYCTGNVVTGNYLNGLGYYYQVKIVQGTRNVVAFNGSPDTQPALLGLVRAESGTDGNGTTRPSIENLVIGNYRGGSSVVHLSEDAASTRKNQVMHGNMNLDGNTLLGKVVIDRGGQDYPTIIDPYLTGRIATDGGSAHVWTVADAVASSFTPWEIKDANRQYMALLQGGSPQFYIRCPVSIIPNALNTATGILTIGNGSADGTAGIVLNAPSGRSNEIQLKRGGTNSWLIYDAAAANTLYFRDSANSKMHLTLTAGAGAGGGTTELNTGLKVVGNVGFYNTAPAAKPTISGSRGGNAALASLLTGLAGLGLITDSSSA